MYNLRYHIASLVSVFIALALGLVLGGLIVDEGSPASTQAIVDSLRADYEAVRVESAEVQERNDMLAFFTESVTPALIDDQLTGYSVFVIREDDKTAGEVARVVELAGATPVLFAFDEEVYAALGDESSLHTLIADLEKAAEEEKPEGSETTSTAIEIDSPVQLAEKLVAEWTDDKLTARPYTDALVSDGVLSAPAQNWTVAPMLGIVDATATDQAIESTLATSVLRALADRGYPVIVASTDEEAELEFATESEGVGISTLNTLGTSIGDYTLVSLLKGAVAGHFGSMSNVTAPFALMPAELTLAGKPLPPEPPSEADTNTEAEVIQ
ncbi:MAG: copper transporter [Actinomycetia bacterium]|nr:copper transporter [Actinomycetes bacterium]